MLKLRASAREIFNFKKILFFYLTKKYPPDYIMVLAMSSLCPRENKLCVMFFSSYITVFQERI